MKLSEPDLNMALEIAHHLGFKMSLMAELLPVGIKGMTEGIYDRNSEKTINQT